MGLTRDEHEEMSRIHVLAQFGELPETMQARFNELRARDERLEIPEPTLDIEWIPRQRSRDDALDDAIDALVSAHQGCGFNELEIMANELADFDWILEPRF